jgi:hypothetical protein
MSRASASFRTPSWDLREGFAGGMMARTHLSLIAIALCAPAIRAQASPAPLLQTLTNLDAKQVAEAERGDAVAITLDAADKTEIAMLGVVRIPVPRAFYLDRVQTLTGFLASQTRSAAGAFADPAQAGDVSSLALEQSDARSLEKCKLFSCDVKLPADLMAKLRRELARSRDPEPITDSIMREWVVSYVNAYRADSSEELVVYDDTKRSVRSSEAFRELLSEPMPAGIDSQPFAQMLASPRSARPPEVTSRISWEMDRLSGLKPTLEVVERSIYSPSTHPNESFLATKLLYASHYFESQIDFIMVADAESPAGTTEMYLIIVRRQKFDDLPSGGLFNIRGKAVKRLRDGLRATLANTRTEMMKAYAESGKANGRDP